MLTSDSPIPTDKIQFNENVFGVKVTSLGHVSSLEEWNVAGERWGAQYFLFSHRNSSLRATLKLFHLEGSPWCFNKGDTELSSGNSILGLLTAGEEDAVGPLTLGKPLIDWLRWGRPDHCPIWSSCQARVQRLVFWPRSWGHCCLTAFRTANTKAPGGGVHVSPSPLLQPLSTPLSSLPGTAVASQWVSYTALCYFILKIFLLW